MSESRFLPGDKIGRLTLLSKFRKNRVTFWNAVCDCGVKTTPRQGNLGCTKSCGCLAREVARIGHTTHGESKKKPEWLAWKNMIDRCKNQNHQAYKNYGGRGIRVCPKWRKSYVDFLADVGRKPSPAHTLDRKDNEGDYEPGNVRWATWPEQQRNRRSSVFLKIDGVSRTVSEWARIYKIKISTVFGRLNRGWPPKDALAIPQTLSSRVRSIYQSLLKVAWKDL